MHHANRLAAPRVRDVVCNMMIEPSAAAAVATIDGVVFYFCSEECRRRFTAEPGTFVPELAKPLR